MFIGSRVEPEWRVEGDSHSLTEVFPFLAIAMSQDTHKLSGSPLGEHNGTF